jgi:hypothetical protein
VKQAYRLENHRGLVCARMHAFSQCILNAIILRRRDGWSKAFDCLCIVNTIYEYQFISNIGSKVEMLWHCEKTDALIQIQTEMIQKQCYSASSLCFSWWVNPWSLRSIGHTIKSQEDHGRKSFIHLWAYVPSLTGSKQTPMFKIRSQCSQTSHIVHIPHTCYSWAG